MMWDNKGHRNHLMLLKEFYSLNKYFMTEQTKDTFLDAIDCMERVIKDEGDKRRKDND